MLGRDLTEVGATRKGSPLDKIQYFMPSGFGGPQFFALLY